MKKTLLAYTLYFFVVPAYTMHLNREYQAMVTLTSVKNAIDADNPIYLTNNTPSELKPYLVNAMLLSSSLGKIKVPKYILNLPKHIRPDINHQDPRNAGVTPLLQAVKNNHLTTAQLLLEAGADPNRADNNQITPLMLASYNNNLDMAQALISFNADLKLKNKNGETALMIASQHGRPAIVSLFLKHGSNPTEKDKMGRGALTGSVLSTNKESANKVINMLIAAGADVDETYHTGGTPIVLAAYQNNTEAVKTLLKHSADPNKQTNGEKTTALHMATIHTNIEAVNALLEYGANPNAQDKNGNTPLHIAVEKGNIEIVQKLLEYGADKTIKNKAKNKKKKKGKHTGKTSLDLAKKEGYKKIAKLLQQSSSKQFTTKTYKPKAATRTERPTSPEMPRLPITNADQSPTKTIGHSKEPDSQSKSQEVIRQKKEAPTKVDPKQIVKQQLKKNIRELWRLINEGYAKHLEQFLLSKKTFDLNTRNEQGDTLLTQAVKKAIKDKATRRLNTIQVLLRNEKTKGLTNTPNTSGKTARAIANQANKKRIVRLLAEHGAELEQKATCPRPQPEPEIYQSKSAQPEPEQEEIAQKEGITVDLLFTELSKGNKTKIKNIEAIVSQKPSELTRQRAEGKTPLMHAIESRVTEQILRDILNKLSREHINLEEQTKERDTALTKAIRTGKSAWIKLLINSGALIQDNDLKVARQLYDDAQRADDQEKAKQLYENLDSLTQKKEEQNANNMLLSAADHATEDFKLANRALQAGADINTQDTQDNTPLMRAVSKNNTVVAKGLIERGAHLNTQNQDGETALIRAAKKNNYNLVDYLLQHNANEKIGDASNLTAYGHAQSNGYTDIANRILMYQARNDLQRTGNIAHIINRHTTLGKSKAITVNEQTDTATKPYTGRHADGSTTSFFPRSWGKEKIKEAIVSILEKPEQLHNQPAQITEDNRVLPSALILTGTYDAVQIKVVVSQTDDPHAPWKAFTAYPIKE